MFDTDLKFSIFHLYPSEYKVYKHTHPCYEMVYYQSGEGNITISDKNYTFRDNYISISAPNEIHYESGSKRTELYFTGFTFINEKIKLQSGVYEDKDQTILGLIKQIQSEMNSQQAHYSRMLNIIMEQIVIILYRKMYQKKPELLYEEKINYVINYIKMNCTKNINVEQLAKSVNYSYDYFRHFFNSYMKIPIKEYIMNERIRYTKELLINSEYSIKEISNMCDFSSAPHFSTCFKKIVGITPETYRRQYAHSELIDYKE